MIRVFKRIVQALLFAGFNHWHMLLKAEKMEKKRALEITIKIIGRLMQHHLWVGFKSWRQYIKDMLELLAIMTRVFNRMCNVKMVTGLNTWKRCIQQMRQAEQEHINAVLERQKLAKSIQMMDRVLRRLQRGVLNKGFVSWNRFMDEFSKQVADKDRLDKDMRRSIQMMERVVRRLQRGML